MITVLPDRDPGTQPHAVDAPGTPALRWGGPGTAAGRPTRGPGRSGRRPGRWGATPARRGPLGLALAAGPDPGGRLHPGGRRRRPAPRPGRTPARGRRQRPAGRAAGAHRAVPARPRAEIQPAFGSSGHLAAQIRQGAPFDLFLAANLAYVQDLAAEGIVRPETARPYARGSLVLAVHPEAGAGISVLADLARPEVRVIALANPISPPTAGRPGRPWSGPGCGTSCQPKLVRGRDGPPGAAVRRDRATPRPGLVAGRRRGAQVRILPSTPRSTTRSSRASGSSPPPRTPTRRAPSPTSSTAMRARRSWRTSASRRPDPPAAPAAPPGVPGPSASVNRPDAFG
jgi:hypothetical protein